MDIKSLETKMTRTLTLFIVDGMRDNEAALQALDQLPSTDPAIHLDVQQCSKSVENLYDCPFVKDDEGTGHYGLTGIRELVSRVSHHTP